jgi:hypothetical protein
MRTRIFVCLTLVAVMNSFAQVSGRGVLDLANWNAAEKNILTLNQDWELYWNKLLSPPDFSGKAFTPDALIVPSSWSDLQINGKKTGSQGFATYRLTVINIPAKDLMLDVYSVQTACRVFFNDSMVLEVGSPGKVKAETKPMSRDVQLHLPTNIKTLVLTVQVANFHHRKGGFVHPFELGLSSAIAKQRMMYYILDFVESSALAIMGLFLLALFIFRRKDLSVLYFALFCITLSFRPVISVNYLLSTLFPAMSWQLLLKMEYLAVLFPCLFMSLFIKKLFPQQLPGWIVKAFVVVFVFKIGLTLFFPPLIFSWLVVPLLFIIPLGVLIFAITIIRAMLAKVEGANYAGAGIIILLASLILKVLVYAAILPPVHVLITVLDIGFIFMMSMILGSRFSMQFSRAERLQKKTELQSIEIERKNFILQEVNKNIIDSINYARRIQYSLLPPERYIERKLKELNRKKN